MAHIEDLGSHFDAPIDLVWKLITSEEDHGTSHTDRRNIQGAPDGANAMRLTWEQDVGGQWVKVASRVTMVPPVATVVESIEGPLAGSKFVMLYTPNGAKTGVNVVGDFHSPVIPPAQLEPMVLASLERAFNDDSAALKRMASRARA